MELQPGGTVERPVRWPDDFPDESQRGVTKTVRVSLVEVKRKSVSALDDAFAREVGDFETLEELTAAVRKDLIEEAEREADAAVRAALIDDILSANAFDVPPTWVRQVVAAHAQAYRVPESEAERFSREFRPTAERQVRRNLVIDTIADREKLRATEKDVDERVSEMASRRGADAGQVYAALEKAGRLKEIERAITEDRVFAWLMARNTVEQQ
jgi:trigger factor